MRVFRLTEAGVRCGASGMFVGATAMLSHAGKAGAWAVRPSDELNQELSLAYGLAIDVAGKRAGLAGVARALARGDLALAQIAALLLRFPDPPALVKDAPEPDAGDLAARLFESGLIKDWDPGKHPRTEEPPNRGWFAPKTDEPGPGSLATRGPGSQAPSAVPSWRRYLRLARPFVRNAAKAVAEKWSLAVWSVPIVDAIDAVLIAMESSPTNSGEERVLAQLRASLDPPKTLDELQTPPTQNALGYERHHIVEQNPANIVKSPIAVVLDKFGRNVIDDPSNLVWVPRYKHELVTAFYNSTDGGDEARRRRRRVVNDLDYESQYAAGLRALRMFGVLQ